MSGRRHHWCSLAALTALVGSGPLAMGHPAHEHVRERLDDRLAAAPAAMQFVERGDLSRAQGRWREAEADYRRALEMEPDAWAAHFGLARALAAVGDDAAALEAVAAGQTRSRAPAETGAFRAVAAEVHERRGELAAAADAWQAAVASPRAEIDWHLAYARVLQRQGRAADARAALARACACNPSEALRRAWLETVVDAGDAATAEPLIAAGLSAARRPGTWLLLRARLRLAQGRHAEAAADARQALASWSAYIAPDRVPAAVAASQQQAEHVLRAAQAELGAGMNR
jgi:tetratricopeptide (TPR) repeat protein